MNDAMGSKKKTIGVTSDPLALIAEKTDVSRSKEKVVVSSDSEGSEADDFKFVKNDNKKVEKKDDEKKRDMSRVKCYNCKKEGHFAKDCKKAKVKDYEYCKTKMLLAKKDKDKQVLLAKDQVWMESSSDSDQEINANMVSWLKLRKFFLIQRLAHHYDKSDVDHNDYEEKDQLVDKLISKFHKMIVKCQKRVEKANQQSKDFDNQ
nr:hypothetical protein [Tanacetum cinerariifolium]